MEYRAVTPVPELGRQGDRRGVTVARARHDAAQKRAPRQQDTAHARPMRRHSEPDVYACLRALRAVLGMES